MAQNEDPHTDQINIQEGYKRTTVIVDLSAIRSNIAETKKKVGPDVRVCAVIKADGYGHGAVPIAKALSQDGIDRFAVAIPEEGAALRDAGIKEPILLLGYTSPLQYDLLFTYHLTPTIFAYTDAETLSRMAEKRGEKKKIHIKLDTGMSRIGYTPTAGSLREIKRIATLPGIEIEGIFTHLARADEEDKTHAKAQLERYKDFVRELQAAGVEIPIKHAANSAAIMELPEAYFDMVRSGISTYGLYPSDEVDRSEILLQPAITWQTHISYVKTLPAGVQISYGGTYVTRAKTRVATVPIGYADGYPRSLSNKGRVLIHGRSAPILGRVCMDQFMVDITEIPQARQGDVVTLIGRDGAEFISVEEAAELSGSFNYEFVCGIGKRVPRVYRE